MIRHRINLPMSDGTRLITYVTLPGNGDGKYAVLFARNPYCEAPAPDEPEESRDENDSGWAAAGFAVVDQRCRGKGGSEGECIPFVHERGDGLDTIAWIEKQDWFDGRIYLIGGSYLGYVHLSYMDALPESVKGASLSVMPTDGSLAFFKNGVFKADIGSVWYLGMYHPEKILCGDIYKAFDENWYKYPLSEYMKRVYGFDVPEFNRTWNLRDDKYSCPGSFSDAADAMRKCKVPVMLSDGWAEMFLDGMVQMWHELPEDTRKKSVFNLGPWSHGLGIDGRWVYDFSNGSSPDNYELEWLLWLRDGKPLTHFETGKFHYYHVGRGEWIDADDIPYFAPSYELYPTDEGLLTPAAPDGGSFTYTFDPYNSPWFPGGPNTFCHGEPGYASQPESDFRSDMKTFMTPPLEKELSIEGKIRVELEFSSTADATAFVVRFCCVDLNGNTTIMQDCPMETEKLVPGEKTHICAESGPMCWTLRDGESLRVDIASADSHSYRIHTNYFGDQLTMTEARCADNTIYFGETRIMLPIRK